MIDKINYFKSLFNLHRINFTNEPPKRTNEEFESLLSISFNNEKYNDFTSIAIFLNITKKALKHQILSLVSLKIAFEKISWILDFIIISKGNSITICMILDNIKKVINLGYMALVSFSIFEILKIFKTNYKQTHVSELSILILFEWSFLFKFHKEEDSKKTNFQIFPSMFQVIATIIHTEIIPKLKKIINMLNSLKINDSYEKSDYDEVIVASFLSTINKNENNLRSFYNKKSYELSNQINRNSKEKDIDSLTNLNSDSKNDLYFLKENSNKQNKKIEETTGTIYMLLIKMAKSPNLQKLLSNVTLYFNSEHIKCLKLFEDDPETFDFQVTKISRLSQLIDGIIQTDNIGEGKKTDVNSFEIKRIIDKLLFYFYNSKSTDYIFRLQRRLLASNFIHCLSRLIDGGISITQNTHILNSCCLLLLNTCTNNKEICKMMLPKLRSLCELLCLGIKCVGLLLEIIQELKKTKYWFIVSLIYKFVLRQISEYSTNEIYRLNSLKIRHYDLDEKTKRWSTMKGMEKMRNSLSKIKRKKNEFSYATTGE